MGPTGRSILAVAAGVSMWAVFWIAGTAAAAAAVPGVIRAGEPLFSTPALVGLIAYSVILSAAAGYTTVAITGAGGGRAVWWLAGIQLALGVVIEGMSGR